jgi:hypothetical protein
MLQFARSLDERFGVSERLMGTALLKTLRADA